MGLISITKLSKNILNQQTSKIMRKLLLIIAVVLFVGCLSACEDENITPQKQTQTIGDNGNGTVANDDPGQWD